MPSSDPARQPGSCCAFMWICPVWGVSRPEEGPKFLPREATSIIRPWVFPFFYFHIQCGLSESLSKKPMFHHSNIPIGAKPLSSVSNAAHGRRRIRLRKIRRRVSSRRGPMRRPIHPTCLRRNRKTWKAAGPCPFRRRTGTRRCHHGGNTKIRNPSRTSCI